MPPRDFTLHTRRSRGMRSFIALCSLTRILEDALFNVFDLKRCSSESKLRTVHRLEAGVNDWEDALPEWLRPDHPDYQRDQDGALNLQLSCLAVRLCILRIAVQVSSMSDTRCGTVRLTTERLPRRATKWRPNISPTNARMQRLRLLILQHLCQWRRLARSGCRVSLPENRLYTGACLHQLHIILSLHMIH